MDVLTNAAIHPALRPRITAAARIVLTFDLDLGEIVAAAERDRRKLEIIGETVTQLSEPRA